jgi:2-(1,2-epoxy-1,2-dihydrophenyl)acetyl-CoA isomerase
MGYEQVLYEVDGGIATVTLNRPDKLNAFTGTMGEELWDAFNAAVRDPAVRAIIFTGAGRAFCAGVDLQAVAQPGQASLISAGDFIRKFPEAMYHCPKPSICAMNGHAIGVGVTMAVSFDLRIAAEDAKLAVPFAKLGMLPGFGSTQLLPRLVGRGKALELMLTARSILAPEALQIGLVNQVVPADRVLATARELAAALAGFDPLVLAHVKRSVNASAELDLAGAVESEARIGVELRAAKAARDAG